MKKTALTMICCVALFSLLQFSATAATYKVHHFSELDGDSSSAVVDINNAGMVLYSSGDASHSTDILWSEDTGRTVITGVNGPYVNRVNNSGATVGYVIDSSNSVAVIRDYNGDIHRLPGLTETDNAWAMSLNDSRMVVGRSGFVPVLWDSYGNVRKLMDVDPHTLRSVDINKHGAVTLTVGGNAYYRDPVSEAISQLNPLEGEAYCYASCINDNRQIVGQSGDHAVLWNTDGTVVDLGIGWAFGINNRGQIVGKLNNRAVLWDTDGQIIDLGAGDWSCAMAINDYGQIVGSYESEPGYIHAVLWSPEVPEPTSLAALGLGLIPMAGAVIRRRRK